MRSGGRPRRRWSSSNRAAGPLDAADDVPLEVSYAAAGLGSAIGLGLKPFHAQ
jgi:hypothetical protein